MAFQLSSQNTILIKFPVVGFMNKKCKLLIIGLDNAGKSTLLSKIKEGCLVQHPPTNQPCKLFLYTSTQYGLGC